jgi:ornithine cyclodeaminase
MRLVEVPHVLALIAARGFDRIVGELVDCLEEDFRRWPDFDKSPRYAAHSPDGVVELMPIADASTFACKYVNGHPKNQAAGLQTVTGFGILADVSNGYPYLIAEMTLITALRTAATSVMAARALARPDSRTMAIIGLGAQSEFQAAAFRALTGIDRLRIFDVDPAATRKFLANVAPLGLAIHVAASAADAARGADIVTTVTADKKKATILTDAMVGRGVHINAVGGDCPGKTELDPRILERARVFVEYEPQTRIEGDIQQMPADFPVTELWRVLTGERPGRLGRDDVTLFDSVGFALEDYSALRYFEQATREPQFYRIIDLLARPEDPRDLFGMIGRTEMRAAA